MADTEFAVKVTGTGLALDRKVSADLANRIVMLVLSDGKQDSPLEPAGGTARVDLPPINPAGAPHTHPRPGTATSLSEFLNEHSAQTTSERITAIGLFKQSQTQKNYFTRAELDAGFEQAKVPAPKNPHRDIGNTIRLGWIAPKQGQEKAFYVTGTGETAIQTGFAGGAKAGRKRSRAKKPAKSKN